MVSCPSDNPNEERNVPWFKRKRKGPVNQAKREIPDGLWVKCQSCGEIIYKKELARNLWVCTRCEHHFRIRANDYLEILFDQDSFSEFDSNLRSVDALNFVDSKKYTDRIEAASNKTGISEAIVTGLAEIKSQKVSCGVMDFAYIGGSMGSVVGEKVTRAVERAVENDVPLVIVCASGGARMQESILSLMQMAKTATALTRLHEARLPFITIFTHPTTAGVLASYASLGDVIISEPGALLGFAGPRVIQQTIGKELPDDFQSAEFFREHGFVDIICDRRELRERLALILDYTYNPSR